MVTQKTLRLLEKRERVCSDLPIVFELAFRCPSESSHAKQTLGKVRHEHVSFPEQHDGCIQHLSFAKKTEATEKFFRWACTRIFHPTSLNGCFNRSSVLSRLRPGRRCALSNIRPSVVRVRTGSISRDAEHNHTSRWVRLVGQRNYFWFQNDLWVNLLNLFGDVTPSRIGNFLPNDRPIVLYANQNESTATIKHRADRFHSCGTLARGFLNSI